MPANSPVIAHRLREREEVSPRACAERGVHQHVNVHHFWLLVAVIEPHGRVHSLLVVELDRGPMIGGVGEEEVGEDARGEWPGAEKRQPSTFRPLCRSYYSHGERATHIELGLDLE